MRLRHPVLLALTLFGTISCASSGEDEPFSEAAWKQQVSDRQLASRETVYPFETNPEMAEFAGRVSEGFTMRPPLARLTHLQDMLFDEETFDFTYDDEVTLTAAQAFIQRRGNCLAFTSLFVALSRSMGIQTFFVTVDRAPEVTKEDDLVVVNRHVVAGYFEAGRLHTFDFDLAVGTPYTNHKVANDLKASAMYHTNMGGAAIRGGSYENAIDHLETAAKLDPELGSAWVNLGVVRFRMGDPEGSLSAYRRALLAEPELSSALSNMAFVYQEIGDEAQARATLEAAAKGWSTPFTLIALADAEMAEGNMRTAGKHLKRARRTFPKEPEVYRALARWADRAENSRKAERYRRKSEELQAAAKADESANSSR
ncbi:MAG: tetratricopeptide repeat protein [bacterium]|nr:tetratricopeptide repeat protein [bacterium]